MSPWAIFAACLLVFGPFVFARIYLYYKNRSDWTTISDIYRLDPEAEIIVFETKLSHDLAFRTTVTFDDGFTFYSHDTNREVASRFGSTPTSYELTVTPEMKRQILSNALIAHEKALLKKTRIQNRDSLSYKETIAYDLTLFLGSIADFLRSIFQHVLRNFKTYFVILFTLIVLAFIMIIAVVTM